MEAIGKKAMSKAITPVKAENKAIMAIFSEVRSFLENGDIPSKFTYQLKIVLGGSVYREIKNRGQKYFYLSLSLFKES